MLAFNHVSWSMGSIPLPRRFLKYFVYSRVWMGVCVCVFNCYARKFISNMYERKYAHHENRRTTIKSDLKWCGVHAVCLFIWTGVSSCEPSVMSKYWFWSFNLYSLVFIFHFIFLQLQCLRFVFDIEMNSMDMDNHIDWLSFVCLGMNKGSNKNNNK